MYLRIIVPAAAAGFILALLLMATQWPKCAADSFSVKVGTMLVSGCR